MLIFFIQKNEYSNYLNVLQNILLQPTQPQFFIMAAADSFCHTCEAWNRPQMRTHETAKCELCPSCIADRSFTNGVPRHLRANCRSLACGLCEKINPHARRHAAKECTVCLPCLHTGVIQTGVNVHRGSSCRNNTQHVAPHRASPPLEASAAAQVHCNHCAEYDLPTAVGDHTTLQCTLCHECREQGLFYHGVKPHLKNMCPYAPRK